MESQEIKNLKEEMKKNSISLSKFLIVYCGLYNESMHKAKMSHKDMKQLLPCIKRVSYEEVLKNKNLLYNGEIISVIDSNGNIAPYINPKLNNEFQIYSCTIDNEQEENDFINLELLNLKELKYLSKKLKEKRDYRGYRGVQKIMKMRTSSSKEYKIKKNNMKGNE